MNRIRSNVQKLSNLFHLRRNHPMEDAIWLLEYVAKVPGHGQHLLPSSR